MYYRAFCGTGVEFEACNTQLEGNSGASLTGEIQSHVSAKHPQEKVVFAVWADRKPNRVIEVGTDGSMRGVLTGCAIEKL